jgi:hypothetical protein
MGDALEVLGSLYDLIYADYEKEPDGDKKEKLKGLVDELEDLQIQPSLSTDDIQDVLVRYQQVKAGESTFEFEEENTKENATNKNEFEFEEEEEEEEKVGEEDEEEEEEDEEEDEEEEDEEEEDEEEEEDAELPRTLDDIEALIGNAFPTVATRTEETITRDTYGGNPMVVDDFESIETSIHKNDCLIHSFLLLVSPSFRKLTKKEKDLFADIFRRGILPKLYEAYPIPNQENELATVSTTNFLDDRHQASLERFFSVNIVNFLTPDGKLAADAPTRNYKNTMPFLFIYNPDQQHYRAVRRIYDGDSQYTFSYDEVMPILLKYTYQAQTITKCEFKEGDIVLHKGQQQSIFELVYEQEETKTTNVLFCTAVRFVKGGPKIPLSEIRKVEEVEEGEEAEETEETKETEETEETEDAEEVEEKVPQIELPEDTSKLLELWRTTTDFRIRDQIYKAMKKRNIFPQVDEDSIEEKAGLYPSFEDPRFVNKLLRKQEFIENKQQSWETKVKIQKEKGVGIDDILELMEQAPGSCSKNQPGESKEFELTPSQRFIGQFLAPKTPYMSALLYHGVGVGKTCSAITVAETFLEMFPRKKVIIVAPPNIQIGFRRTIFNESTDDLQLGKTDEEPNQFHECTGNTYLKLSGTEFVRDRETIRKRVAKVVDKRYDIYGYVEFTNFIKNKLLATTTTIQDPEKKRIREIQALRNYFSGRLLIIDEAHNLRDIIEETPIDNEDNPGGEQENANAKAGKMMTPYLRKVLEAAEGMKFLLLTATPMYNDYSEIIFILNLLLKNDKKAELRISDIFDAKGHFLPGGETRLGTIASHYVSFMRGENPFSFPIRLDPFVPQRMKQWPSTDPQGKPVSEVEQTALLKLPFVECPIQDENYKQFSDEILKDQGLGFASRGTLIQAGNWIYPGGGEDFKSHVGQAGFDNTFRKEFIKLYETKKEPKRFGGDKSIVQFVPNSSINAKWMEQDTIGEYSPKTKYILDKLQTMIGVSFIYSRYSITGAVSIALALEVNGYTIAARDKPLLANYKPPRGRQCAFCPRKEKDHDEVEDHDFSPAKYILLTGRAEFSDKNPEAIAMSRANSNIFGKDVKVIVGSQVAGEGIDLKFIREVFVFDSWYHLNKLEQVIGRAIRMCAHFPKFQSGDQVQTLSADKRNCIINLLVSAYPSESDRNVESIDMYQYRQGFVKALQVGKVTRCLKQYAVDCNLNRAAVLIQGLPPVSQTDAHGVKREGVVINDTSFTNLCDWMETCEFKCIPEVTTETKDIDESTYDEFAARWRENRLKKRLRNLFTRQVAYRFEDLQNAFADIPRIALASILADIVGNRSFRISLPNQTGYILYRNGYYLFQPEDIKDTSIPLALRSAPYFIKRDSYDPQPVPKRIVQPIAATTTEEGKAEELDVHPLYKSFWEAMLQWVNSLKEGVDLHAQPQKVDLTESLPNQVTDAFAKRYGDNRLRKYTSIEDSIKQIPWIYKSIANTPLYRERFAQVVAEFLWDEFLSTKEQFLLYQQYQAEPLGYLWKDNLLLGETKRLYRMLNPTTGNYEYKVAEKQSSTWSEAAPATIKELESRDTLGQLRVNTMTTAPIYGFMSFKEGNFIFKTSEPPPVKPDITKGKEKPNKGAECAGRSNVSEHRRLGERIGTEIQTSIQTDLGLHKSKLEDLKNSIRICTTLDLALRFADAMRLREKIWFYRPIPTNKAGHIGTPTKV